MASRQRVVGAGGTGRPGVAPSCEACLDGRRDAKKRDKRGGAAHPQRSFVGALGTGCALLGLLAFGLFVAPAGRTGSAQPAVDSAGVVGWHVRLARGWLRTPAVADGRVFVGGGIGSRSFFAFDARTGARLWEATVSDVGPTAALVHGGRVVFGSESCHVHVLDAETGEVLWERVLGDPITAAPAIADGRIFEVYPGPRGWAVAALALDDGTPLWSTTIGHNAIDAPVVKGGVVYLTLTQGDVVALDARTGRVRWRAAADAIGAPSIGDNEVRVVRWKREGGVFYSREVQVFGQELGRRVLFEALSARLAELTGCGWNEPVRTEVRVDPDGTLHADLEHLNDAVRACLAPVFSAAKIDPIGAHAMFQVDLSRGHQEVVRLDRATGAMRGSLGALALGTVPTIAARSGGNWFWHYEGPRVVRDGAAQFELLGDTLRVREDVSVLGADRVRWAHRERGGASLPALTGEHVVFGTGGGELVVRERGSGREEIGRAHV